jgi:flagellar assembly factor FliW
MSLAAEQTAVPARVVEVRSVRFGTFTVPESQILWFPEGLIGFPAHHRFVIMEHTRPSLLRWLLCVDEPELAFAIVDPADFFPDYRIDPHGLTGAPPTEDLAVCAIVTIPRRHPAGMSANLMAPVVVHVGTRVARQLVLEDGTYCTSHPLLP